MRKMLSNFAENFNNDIAFLILRGQELAYNIS